MFMVRCMMSTILIEPVLPDGIYRQKRNGWNWLISAEELKQQVEASRKPAPIIGNRPIQAPQMPADLQHCLPGLMITIQGDTGEK